MIFLNKPLEDCPKDAASEDIKVLDEEIDVGYNISDLADIDRAILPYVPDRYREPLEEAVTVAPVVRLCDGDELSDGAGELEVLTVLALRKAKEILELPLIQEDPEFASVLRAQAGQVQTILTAQLRADEGRFRKRQVDTLSRLLERMDFEERKMLALN